MDQFLKQESKNLHHNSAVRSMGNMSLLCAPNSTSGSDHAFLSFLGSSQVGNCFVQSVEFLSEGISALSLSPYV